MMKAAVEELAQEIPVTASCAAFGFARSSLYRLRQEPTSKDQTPKSQPHHLALSENERTQVLDILHSERFQDSPPWKVSIPSGAAFTIQRMPPPVCIATKLCRPVNRSSAK